MTRKRGHQLRTAGFETKGEDDVTCAHKSARSFCSCMLIEERKVMKAFSIGILFVLLIDCINEKKVILE